MSRYSEKTFGERYSKGRGLVEYLKQIPTYSPGNNALLPANLNALLDTINTANSNAAFKLSVLQTARAERKDLYYGDAGLIKRCSQMRDFLASLPEGKKAGDFKRMQKIVQDIRGAKIVRKKKSGKEGEAKTKSVSERTFGSIIKQSKDALEIIKSNAAYTPGNPNITVANFTLYLAQVDAKNSEVAEKLNAFDNARYDRSELYIQLKEVVQKIKYALASQYGKNSNDYKDVVKY